MATIRRIGDLDVPGGGQVVVDGNYAYIGHMKPPHGTTILDVSDPRKPCVVSQLMMDIPGAHSHKVRVAGNIMITNVERRDRHFHRRAERLPGLRDALATRLARVPTDAEVAAELGIEPADVAALDATRADGFSIGGFKVWDISDRTAPRELAYVRTHGNGTHRFDMDANYAYISTEMAGFHGNILVIYDLRNPERPEEISRWWIPGQNVAAGETPAWRGEEHRLHHALRNGDELWAATWGAGFHVLDITDIRAPRAVAAHSEHPAEREPTHTVLPMPGLIGGRRIAVGIDEEHKYRHGRGHAKLWIFDVTDFAKIHALSYYHPEESHSPWGSKGRFGAHQYQEHFEDTRVYAAWFAGGLRVIDVADPHNPVEIGAYIPEPRAGQPFPQSNDVDVDRRGLVYLLDRNCGFDILELDS